MVLRGSSWKRIAIGVGATMLSLPAVAVAEVAVAGKAGTLGVGAELTVRLTRSVNARAAVNGYSYSDRRVESGIEYDGEAKLRTAGALLDWHPAGGGFRLSGGVVYNDTAVEGHSLPPASGVYNLGGVPVPAALVGTLDARAEFEPLVPYAGLGWGNAVAPGRRVRFVADLGVIFQGEAEIALTPNLPPGSPILTTPGALQALQILLRREEAELEEEAADYDLYPVLTVGIAVKL